MTAQGHPLSRFRRAVDHGNLLEAEASAREFGRLDLEDALGFLNMIAAREPERYEKAAVRWLGRLLLERPSLSLAQAQLALASRQCPARGACYSAGAAAAVRKGLSHARRPAS